MEPGLGATRDEIRQLLGEPHDTGGTSQRHPTPSIWKYEEIEYHFGLDGRVCLIYTEDSDGEPHVIAERKDEGRTK